MRFFFFRLAINFLLLSSLALVSTASKSPVAVSKLSDSVSKSRQGRATYVKAILSNPRGSPTHLLAEKLAQETLRSPRTQQTLKKLTQIRSAERKRKADKYDAPKRRRKGKRKKHRKKHKPKRHRRKHRKIGKNQISGNTDRRQLKKRQTPLKIQVKRNDIDCIITRPKYFSPFWNTLSILGKFYPEPLLRPRISRQAPNNTSKKIGKSAINAKNNNYDTLHTKNFAKKSVRPYRTQNSRNFNRNFNKYSQNPALPIFTVENVPKNDNNLNYDYSDPAAPIFNANRILKKNSNFDKSLNIENYDYVDPGFPISRANEDFNPFYSQNYIPPQNIPGYSGNSLALDPQLNYQSENRRFFDNRTLSLAKHDVSTENSTANCTNIKIDNSTGVTKISNQLKEVENLIPVTVSRPEEANGGLETKQVANEILNDIIEELEELKVDHNKKSPREGLPCKISGTWSTIQAGVELKLKVTNHTLNVTLEKMPTSAKLHTGILNTTWNITGHVPFKRGAPFALIASNSFIKSLATFVGACRVCQGIDTIEGVWSVMREPRTCRDLPASGSTYSDVFRRIIATPKTKKRKT